MHPFNGFPPEGFDFLEELAQNNNKTWFNDHKAAYEKYLLAPAKDFIVVLGERLQSIAPRIQIDTRTNGQGNLMRIYRDTRFSKDKSPYKTNIAGIFWEGTGKKTANPGFGFHMGVKGMELMAGMFAFSKEQLAAYRAAVDGPGSGSELQDILNRLGERGGYGLVGEHYKKVPRGYPADHPRERLLRFNALYVHPLTSIPVAQLQTAELIDRCLERFTIMAPVQSWLVKYLSSA